MGNKEFHGYMEEYGDIDEEGFKYWWEDYDGDIEEERREIEERVSKIEDPEEREAQCEQLLNALEYDEYFAHNPHFKSESSLIILRRYYLKGHEDKNTDDFINVILRHTNMKRCPFSETQNILIVNGNKKFTFLNTTKRNIGNHPCLYDLSKKGETKLRREYGSRWIEGYDDDKRKFSVLWVKLCEWEKDEDDDNEFITVCDRIKAKYFNS